MKTPQFLLVHKYHIPRWKNSSILYLRSKPISYFSIAMMLIHIASLYATFALAHPSTTNPTWQNKPISDVRSEERKAIQILDQGVCHAGIGVSTRNLEALDASRSKTFPSPVENISSLLLSYAEAGAEGRWDTTIKHTKALLDSLTDSATQDDSHVPDSDRKINLQDLSTTFLGLLPLTIPSQAHSRAMKTNSVNLYASPKPSNGTLSSRAIDFLTLHATSLSLTPVLAIFTLSMIKTDLPHYNAELDKYKTELELLRTSYLKTSKPIPFSKDQCQMGVMSVLQEISRKPVAALTYMGVATMGGLVLTIAGLLSGMIIMAYDSGIENVFKMTHTSIREWAALMNGDAASCEKYPPLMGDGVNLTGFDVIKVKNEVARDPEMFISDALSFAGGFDIMKMMRHAEKVGETTNSFPSRWTDFIVGLPDALELEYKQEGQEAFLEMITPKVRKFLQMNCILRDTQ